MNVQVRDYTETQVNRIRNALNSYRIAASRDGYPPSWVTVRDSIIFAEPNIDRYKRGAENTFHPERLRRFAVGEQRLDVSKLGEIARFLLHQGTLKADELDGSKDDLGQFLAVREFLGNDDASARAYVAGLKRDYAVQIELSGQKAKALHLRLIPDPSHLFLRVEEIVLLRARPDQPTDHFRRDDDVRLYAKRTGYALPVTPRNVLHIFLAGKTPEQRLTYVQLIDARQGQPEEELMLMRNGEDHADDLDSWERDELPPFANVYRFNTGTAEAVMADARRSETKAKRERWQWRIDGMSDLEIEIESGPALPVKVRDLTLIDSAKIGNIHYLDLAIYRANNDSSAINQQDDNGMTALHHVAAMGARDCVRSLVNCGLCDYLMRDNAGRTAAELAYEWSEDRAVAALLAKKEMRQMHHGSLGHTHGKLWHCIKLNFELEGILNGQETVPPLHGRPGFASLQQR